MTSTPSPSCTLEEMTARLVRYAELRPCTSAFIDTRTPGSDRKENFTIIGPGVAENPEQHVHIRIPHGFNIGGARQPPGCTNSQHSHDTAEVFVIQQGQFRFKTGEHGTSGHVDLGPGDVISIPVHAFRGFDTLGDETAFMFSVLGGDDPGRVLWAPYVFEAAREYGLVLLRSGRLIDTRAGESVPADDPPMQPTSAADIARLRVFDSAGIAGCTVARAGIQARARRSFRAAARHRRVPAGRHRERRRRHRIRAARLATWLPGARTALRPRCRDPGARACRRRSAADASRRAATRLAGRRTASRPRRYTHRAP